MKDAVENPVARVAGMSTQFGGTYTSADRTKLISTGFRAAIAAGISLVPITQALAQTSSAGEPPAETHSQVSTTGDSSDDPSGNLTGQVSDIVVTGTRLQTTGYAQPTPVTVASTAELFKSTPTNLADALNNNLPQFVNSSGPGRSLHNFASSSDSGNFLNLRGVGPDLTLILFDGVRVPPTTYRGNVNIDVLPEMLVQRVDVVTAGASAVYGSDAVAGVVNYILDKEFKGVTGQAQYGISNRGDKRNYKFGIAAGSDIFGGRGHILFSAETFKDDGLLRIDRDASRYYTIYAGSIPGSLSVQGSAQNPFKLWPDGTIAISSKTGLIVGGPGAFTTQINATGTGVVPFNPGTPTGTPAYYSGGDGLQIPGTNSGISPIDTKKIYARLSYDVTPDITAHVEGNYTRVGSSYALEGNSFILPTAAPVFSGNPYLPASMQAALTASGAPAYLIDVDSFGREPVTTEVTRYWSVKAGLNGKLGENWTWNIDYSRGDSRQRVIEHKTLDWRKTFAALDAVRNPANGQIVCNASINPNPVIAAAYADCRPFNVLQPFSTPAGYAYLLGDSAYQANVVMNDVEASVQGNLIDLPAGPVKVAVGGDYRTESLKLTSNADPALLDTSAEFNAYFAGLRGVPGNTLFYWLDNVGTADGKQNVKEVFAEMSVPILSDVPLARSLTITGAARVTDYKTSGTVVTWKGGGEWSPVDGIRLRGTYSRDIKAPTVYSLFAGTSSSIGQVTDPVRVALGDPNATGNVQAINTGNVNLKPEIGKTLTFGAVFQPSAFPGFTMSVDYYRLKINGIFGSLTAQQIVQYCYDSAGHDSSPYCASVIRATPSSFPTSVTLQTLNLSEAKTSGIDLDASYNTRLGAGQLGIRLIGNYLIGFSQQLPGTPNYDLEGTIVNATQAYPRFRGTLNVNYRLGGFELFVSEQYIHKLTLNNPFPNNNYVDPHVNPVWYTNTTISYKVKSDGVGLDLYLTVNNLFDRKFPFIPAQIPGANVPTIISLYDQVGRAFTVGTRVRF